VCAGLYYNNFFSLLKGNTEETMVENLFRGFTTVNQSKFENPARGKVWGKLGKVGEKRVKLGVYPSWGGFRVREYQQRKVWSYELEQNVENSSENTPQTPPPSPNL
jgi:hypothetical protein